MNARAQKAILLRQHNPCMTCQDIANHLGVTREAIRQYLSKEGLPTRAQNLKVIYKCNQCGQEFKSNGKNPLFCSIACRKEYYQIPLICDTCGQLFTRHINAVAHNIRIGEHIFCSKRCQGIWAGNHYGFIAHPENRGYVNHKWDWDAVYSIHKRTGFGCLRLSRLTGIPQGTISLILREKRKNNHE